MCNSVVPYGTKQSLLFDFSTDRFSLREIFKKLQNVDIKNMVGFIQILKGLNMNNHGCKPVADMMLRTEPQSGFNIGFNMD
jgi:hypothetical protein